jgi:hypothetical protein
VIDVETVIEAITLRVARASAQHPPPPDWHELSEIPS